MKFEELKKGLPYTRKKWSEKKWLEINNNAEGEILLHGENDWVLTYADVMANDYILYEVDLLLRGIRKACHQMIEDDISHELNGQTLAFKILDILDKRKESNR